MTNRFFRKTLAAVVFLLMAGGVTCVSAQTRPTQKQTEQIKNEIKAFMVSHKGAKFRVYAKLGHPVKDIELERILAEKLFGSGNANVSQALDKYLAQYEKWKRETSFYENSYVSSSDIRLFSKNLDKYNDGDVVFGVFYNGSGRPISKEVDSYVPFMCYKRYVGTNKKFSNAVAGQDEVNTIFTYDTGEKRLLNVTDVFSAEAITRLQIDGSTDNTEVMVKPSADNIIYSVMAQGEKELRQISMSQNPEAFTEKINRLVQLAEQARLAVVKLAEERRKKMFEAAYEDELRKQAVANTEEQQGEVPQEKLEKLAELKRAYFMDSESEPTETDTATNERPYDIAEQMPEFPGGSGELMEWMSRATQYPDEAQEKGIQGRVIVRFIVGADGSVSKAQVVRSVHPLLDMEALVVISAMPRWTPGRLGGKVVPVWYTLPVTFQLK